MTKHKIFTWAALWCKMQPKLVIPIFGWRPCWPAKCRLLKFTNTLPEGLKADFHWKVMPLTVFGITFNLNWMVICRFCLCVHSSVTEEHGALRHILCRGPFSATFGPLLKNFLYHFGSQKIFPGPQLSGALSSWTNPDYCALRHCVYIIFILAKSHGVCGFINIFLLLV
jgi:hypothetical protein